ncbi:MAG TPA: UpxY family transcription antiterminator [Ferruginibacter sp.]|nr:UpxY family transcription antiterminator [Ferruginibacter sp.]
MNRNWYAVYTKAQSETKVVALLSKKRIENFCPHKRMIVGNGMKRRMIYEPLFPSFVFVNITEIQMYEVRKTNDVINFVYWLGRPAIIKTEEIESIARFNGSYYNIQVEKSPVNAAGKVKFSSEPALVQQDRNTLNVNTTRVKLNLPSLGYTIYAETSIEQVPDTVEYDVATTELA